MLTNSPATTAVPLNVSILEEAACSRYQELHPSSLFFSPWSLICYTSPSLFTCFLNVDKLLLREGGTPCPSNFLRIKAWAESQWISCRYSPPPPPIWFLKQVLLQNQNSFDLGSGKSGAISWKRVAKKKLFLVIYFCALSLQWMPAVTRRFERDDIWNLVHTLDMLSLGYDRQSRGWLWWSALRKNDGNARI